MKCYAERSPVIVYRKASDAVFDEFVFIQCVLVVAIERRDDFIC